MQASTSNQGIFWEEAREQFEEIVTWLDSDSICGLEHGEIESKLLSNGYELLRRLLQGYLNVQKIYVPTPKSGLGKRARS